MTFYLIPVLVTAASTQRWEIRSEYSDDLDSSPSHIGREQRKEKGTNRAVWAITEDLWNVSMPC